MILSVGRVCCFVFSLLLLSSAQLQSSFALADATAKTAKMNDLAARALELVKAHLGVVKDGVNLKGRGAVISARNLAKSRWDSSDSKLCSLSFFERSLKESFVDPFHVSIRVYGTNVPGFAEPLVWQREIDTYQVQDLQVVEEKDKFWIQTTYDELPSIYNGNGSFALRWRQTLIVRGHWGARDLRVRLITEFKDLAINGPEWSHDSDLRCAELTAN